MNLNLGCGSQVIDGWVNVDYALGAKFAKLPFARLLNRKQRLFDLAWNDKIYIHDLTQTFPWHKNSCDIIYSSHCLEHFSREAGHFFLKECHRVLRKEGIIRIVVPDLQNIVKQYIDGHILADKFVEELGVLYVSSRNSVKNRLAPLIQFPHKCMYDTARLLEILGVTGFDAKSREPFDSGINDIQLIESKERTENAVIVEGYKL